MKFFWLRSNTRPDHQVQGRHRWGLPGIKCDGCGETWAQTGVAYPSVDLANLADSSPFERLWPVSPQEFKRLRELISAYLPSDMPVPPGTELGPFTGEARGELRQCVWPTPWTLLMTGDYHDLLARSLQLGRAVPSQLNGAKAWPPMLELEIEPFGTLAASSQPSPTPDRCGVCGRDPVIRPDVPILDAASLPAHRDIFRLTDLPTMIVCSETFADVVIHDARETFRLEELQLSDLAT